MDGFEPVCFTLTVIAVDDVETRSPKDFAAKISKVIYFEGFEDHREILTHAVQSPQSQSLLLKNKKRSFLE